MHWLHSAEPLTLHITLVCHEKPSFPWIMSHKKKKKIIFKVMLLEISKTAGSSVEGAISSKPNMITILAHLQHIVVRNNTILWHLLHQITIWYKYFTWELLYISEFTFRHCTMWSRVTFNCTTVSLLQNHTDSWIQICYYDQSKCESIHIKWICQTKLRNYHNNNEAEKVFINWTNSH